MKQQDVALIIFVVGISAVISFFASNAIFASGKKKEQVIVKIDPISAEFIKTNDEKFTKYFNGKSINPTKLIQIGDSNNDNPFNGASQ